MTKYVSLKEGRLPAALFLFAVLLFTGQTTVSQERPWSEGEVAILKTLWIRSLSPLPPSPSNSFADNPKAAALGEKFFFDTTFSGNKKVSCGTCHRPDYQFTDNLSLAHGMGTTARRTMPILGAAYQSWFFWDGRKDSLWSQALGPIESPVEHGFTRTQCFLTIRDNYRAQYEEVFGPLPEIDVKRLPAAARPADNDAKTLKAWVSMTEEMRAGVNRVYANLGKAIAAFMRTVLPGPSRFDTYVEALLRGDYETMRRTCSPEEEAGLRLFIGKAKCINCHNGPLLANGDFHNVRVPDPQNLSPDTGRADGILKVLADEFNCLGRYSDAAPRECGELRFIDTDREKYLGAFKTPTLRNVADRPPYMHAGQFQTLAEVLRFYRDGAQARAGGAEHRTDIEHGDLNDAELVQLEAFLRTLSGPVSSF